ncbi:MAG TPA: RluA family pseudouridine synthase [Candidatus Paceibacterota bacterium]
MNDSEPAVLAESTHWVALGKPAGWLTHPDGRTNAPALSEWFVAKYPEAAGVGEPQRTLAGEEIARPGVVHRLDRDTTGVVLLARTAEGYDHLKRAFAERLAGKRYRAFAWGNIVENEMTIRLPIGRARGDFRKKSASAKARGETREAETRVAVLARIVDGGEHLVFIEAEPVTGRTHQIRAHLAAVHHPVVGDKLYAPGRSDALGFSRLALHALRISFPDLDGARREIEAPYPADFAAAVQTFVDSDTGR